MDISTENIWEEYRSKLLQFVTSRVGNPNIAEDIIQEVFEKIFEKIDSLKSGVKLQSWLYQIARNAIIDYYRSNKPILELPELPQPVEDPNAKELKDLSECLLPMIDKLSEPYKKAIILSEIEGKTHKEIAASRGISLSGSKSRVQRGRAQLKKMLADCCRLEFDHHGRFSGYEPKQDSCSDCQSPKPETKLN